MSEWIPLPGYPGYSATADGRVMGRRGKELRPFVNGQHAAAVNLYRGGEVVRVDMRAIQRMVAETRGRAA